MFFGGNIDDVVLVIHTRHRYMVHLRVDELANWMLLGAGCRWCRPKIAGLNGMDCVSIAKFHAAIGMKRDHHSHAVRGLYQGRPASYVEARGVAFLTRLER